MNPGGRNGLLPLPLDVLLDRFRERKVGLVSDSLCMIAQKEQDRKEMRCESPSRLLRLRQGECQMLEQGGLPRSRCPKNYQVRICQHRIREVLPDGMCPLKRFGQANGVSIGLMGGQRMDKEIDKHPLQCEIMGRPCTQSFHIEDLMFGFYIVE